MHGTRIFTAGPFAFDPSNFTVTNGEKKTELTQREAALLQYFFENKNTVLKREQILSAVWGQDDYFFGRSLDVFISKLRKVFAGDDTVKIDTLHGIGFKLVVKT